jgi:DNA-binding transcriptional LysR family regulator
MGDVDLNLLPTLDALLQEGSVTGAARRLRLSVAATSHALARLREQLDDPLLVRAGHAMVLTPYAESLRSRTGAALLDARALLAPKRPVHAADLDRAFTLHATDHVLSVMGPALDRILYAEAPRAVLRVLPTSQDDAASLRKGAIDLAVGIYGDLPPEMRTRPLFTDRFVCAVREGNPHVGPRISLEDYVRLPHVQVAPRGRPGGYVDHMLAERGLGRRVVRAVPYFMTGLLLAAESDAVLTISERLARIFAPRLGLRLLEPPLPLLPYTLSLLWHPRVDGDAAHRWLRDAMLRAAKDAAGDVHERARRSLHDATRKKRRPKA